jgi:hypothetical protein
MAILLFFFLKKNFYTFENTKTLFIAVIVFFSLVFLKNLYFFDLFFIKLFWFDTSLTSLFKCFLILFFNIKLIGIDIFNILFFNCF